MADGTAGPGAHHADGAPLVPRARGKALTSGIRPIVDPVFEAAAAQGILREGVSPEDASRWLQIVASGLVRSPDIVPHRKELVELLDKMLVPTLIER
jgi:hypothetical protein